MTDSAPVVRDARPLRLLAWLLAVLYGWWCLKSLAFHIGWSFVFDANEPETVEDFFTVLRWLAPVSPILQALAVWPLIQVTRATDDRPARWFLATTAICFALMALLSAAWFVDSLVETRLIGDLPLLTMASFGVSFLGHVALVLAFLQLARRLRADGVVAVCWLALVFVILQDGVEIVRITAPEWLRSLDAQPVMAIARLGGLWVTSVLVVAAAFLVARATPVAGQPRVALHPSEWDGPLAGLRLYRGALLAKIAFLVVAMLIIIAGNLNQSVGAIKGGVVFAAVSGAAASVAMFVGLIRFGAVPRETGIGDAVFGVVALFAVGLFVEAWALVEAVRFLEASGFDLLDILERMRIIDAVGQVIGLMALLALLVALKRTAQWFAAERPIGRVTTLRVLLALLVPFAVVLRLEKVLRSLGGPGLLFIGLAVLALAVTMVCLYVGLLGQVVQVIETGRDEPGGGPPTPIAATAESFDPAI